MNIPDQKPFFDRVREFAEEQRRLRTEPPAEPNKEMTPETKALMEDRERLAAMIADKPAQSVDVPAATDAGGLVPVEAARSEPASPGNRILDSLQSRKLTSGGQS